MLFLIFVVLPISGLVFFYWLSRPQTPNKFRAKLYIPSWSDSYVIQYKGKLGTWWAMKTWLKYGKIINPFLVKTEEINSSITKIKKAGGVSSYHRWVEEEYQKSKLPKIIEID